MPMLPDLLSKSLSTNNIGLMIILPNLMVVLHYNVQFYCPSISCHFGWFLVHPLSSIAKKVFFGNTADPDPEYCCQDEF